MGEALMPNTKVGTKFMCGRDNLIIAAKEVRKAVSMSTQDTVVIEDEKFKGNGTDAKAHVEKTGEVLKAAGLVKLVFHFCSQCPFIENHDLRIINRDNAISLHEFSFRTTDRGSQDAKRIWS
jgi:hypothetical protein